MLCLPLKPIDMLQVITDESTSPDDVAEALWNNLCIEGITGTGASVCVIGSIAVDVIHDLACELYADDMFDVEISIDEYGHDDGMTWINFDITGEINADGRAEMAEHCDDPYEQHGVKRSDFI